MMSKRESWMVRVLLIGYLVVAAYGVRTCSKVEIKETPASEIVEEKVSPIEKLHESFLKAREFSSAYVPEGLFHLHWKYPEAARDTINGFIVIRDEEVVENAGPYDSLYTDYDVEEKIRYFYSVRAYKIGAEGDTTYTAEEIYLFLQPENEPYYSENWKNIYFSPESEGASAMWLIVGPEVSEREWVWEYDSLWSVCDLMLVSVPANHPHSLRWQREPFEAVIWKGYFDINGDCVVGLVDLTFFADNYGRSACDSVGVE